MDGGLWGGPGVAGTQVGMGWVVPEQPDPAHLNQPSGLLPTPVHASGCQERALC